MKREGDVKVSRLTVSDRSRLSGVFFCWYGTLELVCTYEVPLGQLRTHARPMVSGLISLYSVDT